MRKRFLLMVCWAWLFCTQGQKGSSNRQLSSSIAEIDPHIEKRGNNDEQVETADAKLHKARIQSSKAEATAVRNGRGNGKRKEDEPLSRSANQKRKKTEIADRNNDLAKLKDFFRETYMEIVKGDLTHFHCFQTPWNLYHMHNVCIKNGNDGIITGIEERPNDWMQMKSENQNIRSGEDWNELNMKPTMAIKIPTKEIKGVTFVQGNNVLSNCHQQEEEKKNPAHWMMKLGILFEMATCEKTGKKYKLSQFKSPQIELPFDGVFMHQCPQKSQHAWPWGDDVYKIVEEGMQDAGLLGSNYRFHDEFAFQPLSEIEKEKPGILTCFDDVYISPRTGIWLTKPQNIIAFRLKSFEIYGEPRQIYDKKTKRVMETPKDLESLVWKPYFCDEYAGYKKLSTTPIRTTSARIRIFQRSDTENLRKFMNLDEVIALAQTFTSIPVEVVTVNKTSTIEEQIRLFNSFDVLITPHGSHLANGIFTMKPNNKAVVEVVSYAFDRVFYSNYNSRLGFGGYYMSTGHLTPEQPNARGKHCKFRNKSDFNGIHCKSITHSYPKNNNIKQTILECPEGYDTRQCDTLVDVKILKKNLIDIFDSNLCRYGLKSQLPLS